MGNERQQNRTNCVTVNPRLKRCLPPRVEARSCKISHTPIIVGKKFELHCIENHKSDGEFMKTFTQLKCLQEGHFSSYPICTERENLAVLYV